MGGLGGERNLDPNGELRPVSDFLSVTELDGGGLQIDYHFKEALLHRLQTSKNPKLMTDFQSGIHMVLPTYWNTYKKLLIETANDLATGLNTAVFARPLLGEDKNLDDFYGRYSVEEFTGERLWKFFTKDTSRTWDLQRVTLQIKAGNSKPKGQLTLSADIEFNLPKIDVAKIMTYFNSIETSVNETVTPWRSKVMNVLSNYSTTILTPELYFNSPVTIEMLVKSESRLIRSNGSLHRLY